MSDQPSSPDGTSGPVVLPLDRWATFVGWHREASLYREIYTRTVATLVAAFVVYVVAALAGFVSARPILVVFIGVGVFGVIRFLITLLDVIRYRKHILPLFRGTPWGPVKTREELVYRRIYTRLTWSFTLSIFLAIPIQLWAQTP